jgi:hypothetical protein
MAGEAQRRGREARHRVECEADHLAERVFGLARMPLGAIIGERHLAKADPCDHAPDEACLFRQRQEGVERTPTHQPEVAGVERDRRVGDTVEDAVEDGGGDLLEDRLALAPAADGIDDIGLLGLHRPAHVAEQFGGILQIGVDDQDLVARAEIEARGQRQLMAMIARQVDGHEMGVVGGKPLHHRPAAIPRPVIDEQQLVILAHHRPCCRGDAGVKQLETGGLVIAGNDDRECGTGHRRGV